MYNFQFHLVESGDLLFNLRVGFEWRRLYGSGDSKVTLTRKYELWFLTHLGYRASFEWSLTSETRVDSLKGVTVGLDQMREFPKLPYLPFLQSNVE